MSDEQLIAMCAHGKRNAMDVLVLRHHARLLDFVFRQVHNHEMAADIVQSTFVRIFENAASYRIKGSFKTWMYTIALNLIKDEYRKRSVRPEMLRKDIEEGVGSGGWHAVSPENLAIDNIRDENIWHTVDSLPENQRIAIILRFRQGLTYEEIAGVMHVPCGTVKSWVHYALRALRQSLEQLACED
ncbi:MAG: RNA polymerase sigma factor [Armatimonadota bacterium]